jgi:hypothetical protein
MTQPAPDTPATTPLRCLTGAVIAGSLGTALYFLTCNIANTFAAKPLPTVNATAANLAVAVRTLVVGVATLGTSVFAIAAVGLLALAVQLQFTRQQQP